MDPVALQGALPSAHLSPIDLFLQADLIVKSIIVLLILASVVSWGVIVDKIVRFRSLNQRAQSLLGVARSEHALQALTKETEENPKDPFSGVFRALVSEWQESRRLGLDRTHADKETVKERIHRVAQIATGIEFERLQKGVQLLATIGSVAPFVGLFGTVWGIMNSFQGIAASNNTSLAVVAPGIAEALFATALGLVAAIPAVIGYNRAAGDLARYAKRIGSLTGIAEVLVSRELSAAPNLHSVPASDRANVAQARPANAGGV